MQVEKKYIEVCPSLPTLRVVLTQFSCLTSGIQSNQAILIMLIPFNTLGKWLQKLKFKTSNPPEGASKELNKAV